MAQDTAIDKAKFVTSGQIALAGLKDISDLKLVVDSAKTIVTVPTSTNAFISEWQNLQLLLDPYDLDKFYTDGVYSQVQGADDAQMRADKIRASVNTLANIMIGLVTVINEKDENQKNNYTTSSYNAIIVVKNSPTDTVANQSAYISSAQGALAGLVSVVALRNALLLVATDVGIDQFQIKYNLNEYTDKSWNALNLAIQSVADKTLFTNGTPDIDPLTKSLSILNGQLVSTIGTSNINLKDVLNKDFRYILVTDGESEDRTVSAGANGLVNTGDAMFTAQSWSAFQDKLLVAQNAANGALSTVAIDSAISSLAYGSVKLVKYSDLDLRNLLKLYNQYLALLDPEAGNPIKNNGGQTYTDKSWTEYVTAMGLCDPDGQNSPYPTVEDTGESGKALWDALATDLYNRLANAYYNLVERPNKDDLLALYNTRVDGNGDPKYLEEYFTAGWADYNNAMQNALRILNDGEAGADYKEANQNEVDVALATLTASIARLRLDMTALNDLVTRTAPYMTAQGATWFDTASYNMMATSRTTAVNTLTDDTIDYFAYKSVLDNFTDAVDGLKVITTTLNDLVQKASNTDLYKSTNFSKGFDAFQTALTTAQGTLAKDPYELTYEEYSASETGLRNAMNALIVNKADLDTLLRLLATSAYNQTAMGDDWSAFNPAFTDAKTKNNQTYLSIEDYVATYNQMDFYRAKCDLRTAINLATSTANGTDAKYFSLDCFSNLYVIAQGMTSYLSVTYNIMTVTDDTASLNNAKLTIDNAMPRTPDDFSGWKILEAIDTALSTYNDPSLYTLQSYKDFLDRLQKARDYVTAGDKDKTKYSKAGIDAQLSSVAQAPTQNTKVDGDGNAVGGDNKPIDKSGIYNIIKNWTGTVANGYNDYDAKVLSKYNSDMNNLVTIYNNVNATQDQVDSALGAFVAPTVPKDALNASITEAKRVIIDGGVGRNDGNKAEWDAFNTAYAKALEVKDDQYYNADQVRDTANKLVIAMCNLLAKTDPNMTYDALSRTPYITSARALAAKITSKSPATTQPALASQFASLPALTPDKDPIRKAINAGNALITSWGGEDAITADSLANYTTALTNAQAVLDDPDATREQILAVTSALNSAINLLKLAPPAENPNGTNKTAIADALALGEYAVSALGGTSVITSDSLTAYNTARNNALTVWNNPDATQAEIDAVAKALLDASKALKIQIPTGHDTDKTALANAYSDAVKKVLDLGGQANITPETWAEYLSAKDNAMSVLYDPNATDAQVRSALTRLNNAVKALAVIPPPPAPEKEKKSAPIGLIIGLSVGFLVVAGCGGAGGFFFMTRHTRKLKALSAGYHAELNKTSEKFGDVIKTYQNYKATKDPNVRAQIMQQLPEVQKSLSSTVQKSNEYREYKQKYFDKKHADIDGGK